MRLRDKTEKPATEDRAELKEKVIVGASPGQKLVGAVAAVGAVGVIFGGLAYNFWYLPHQKAQGTPAQAKQSSQEQAPPSSPSLHLNPLGTAQAADPQPIGGQPPLPPGLMGGMPASAQPQAAGTMPMPAESGSQQPSAQQQQKEQQEREILKRKLASDMGGMPNQSGARVMPVAATATQAGAPAAPATPAGATLLSGNATGANDFSGRLIPTSTPKVAATYIPNPSLTIKKGTPIRCTLDTAMNSDAPGFVSCTVSKPVYGMDGKVVLVDRGSTIDGEMAKGPERGKKRAQVLWGRIVTPLNIAIQVNSPGTDTLGAAGLDGSIDNHYCERFCGAFLFSGLQDILQGGLQAMSNKSSGNTTVVLPQNTLNSGQNAAGEILMQGRDVQPTFTKNQGDEITITVARDLDFSTAYHLEEVQQ